MCNDSPLAAGKNDVMANGDDRHWWNPLTPPVHSETVDRMGHKSTHDHQGQSLTAHQQAGYRRAVHPPFTSASNTLHHRGSPYSWR